MDAPRGKHFKSSPGPGPGLGSGRASGADRPAPGRASGAARPAAGAQRPSGRTPQPVRSLGNAPRTERSASSAPQPASSPYERSAASAYGRSSRPAKGAAPRVAGQRSGRASESHRNERTSSRARNVIPYVLIGIGVVLLLAAAGLFVKAQMGYKESANYYGGLEEAVLTDDEGKGVPKIDFAALKAECEDVVGWIYIPDTKVNYMVVQGETNDTYLRHLPSGEYNVGGSIFLDMDHTAPGAVDQQTTIYGHHMNDGSMFEFIDQTLSQDVFDTVDEVYYITEETTFVYKPMFTMQVPDNYVSARQANFDSPEGLRTYLQESLAQAKASAKDAGSEVEKAERVLTLVTCAGEILPRTTRAGMVCTLVDSYEN